MSSTKQCVIPDWRTDIDKLNLKSWCNLDFDYNTTAVNTGGNNPELYGKTLNGTTKVVGTFANDIVRSPNPSIEGFSGRNALSTYNTLSSCNCNGNGRRVLDEVNNIRQFKETDVLGQQSRQVNEGFRTMDKFVTTGAMCGQNSSYLSTSRTYIL